MTERNELVAGLVAEILGPRGGPREQMVAPRDPLDEYITGVLSPWQAPSVEADADADLLGEADAGDDDETDAGAEAVAPVNAAGGGVSPALDPRMRPSSLGLSISVESTEMPTLDLCATWARYEDRQGIWHRMPRGQIWTALDCTRPATLIPPQDTGIRIEIRVRRQGSHWRVSLFLVNATPPDPADSGIHVEVHVFQPQLRVVCGRGTRLVPVDDARMAGDDEADSLALLYRNRRSFARGHLCGVTWREADPERPHPTARPLAAPFTWADGAELFDAATRGRFSPPDARTEFTPVVPVNAPRMDWGVGRSAAWLAGRQPPELDPLALSECITGAEISAALTPLGDGYEAWIVEQGTAATQLPSAEATIAATHLGACRDVLGRIRAGIDLLVRDPDARLAFCFANRAIALQAQWPPRRRVVPWRPFQLAFQLMNLAALRDARHPDRALCDLLWFPTGGGKTEAYLGLAAFTIALRRLLARRTEGDPDRGAGVAVLSRYTLRLLTIQQFRRAASLVTACEMLRTDDWNGMLGWRPARWPDRVDAVWGRQRFSIGLWVGGAVTPNALLSIDLPPPDSPIHGAVDILRGKSGEGEPAQLLRCPACLGTLALPSEGYRTGQVATLHLVVACSNPPTPVPPAATFSRDPFDVQQVSLTPLSPDHFSLGLTFRVTGGASSDLVDRWFDEHVRSVLGAGTVLVPARASRPGYFLRPIPTRGGRERVIDFAIFCPEPECPLNVGRKWSEHTPVGPAAVPSPFESAPGVSTRCPIPAYTVDDQVYHRCPSVLVATVDKFARLAFEARAGSIFGNVDRYSTRHGWFRAWAPPTSLTMPSMVSSDPPGDTVVPARPFPPPTLVLQDELHLIDGPLGSMVGIYETVIDQLATRLEGGTLVRPKYVASTATVRRATDQVRALYTRDLAQFPPPGLSIDDSFFAVVNDTHPLDSSEPGRLYLGVCAPGRGAQTPIVRLWSRLLQHVEDRRGSGVAPAVLDPFWTFVGYFNAIRELAGAVALMRQDIPQRLAGVAQPPRPFDPEDPLELSSRADSLTLPGLLDRLQDRLGASRPPVNVAVCTSMFGTGVDVPRLGLMCVHGQPKTTSSYIQATGRVGREAGGLVVTFLRAARPRDLNHYEFFTSYHRALYRHVEPVTVSPFSPRARDRALGPVAVAMLRQAAALVGPQATPVSLHWRIQQLTKTGGRVSRAGEMAQRRQDADVVRIAEILEERATGQPLTRRPSAGQTLVEAQSELDLWCQLAALVGQALLYYEPSMLRPPSQSVVLGDPAHAASRLRMAYENAPNSLREVEATTTFRGWR